MRCTRYDRSATTRRSTASHSQSASKVPLRSTTRADAVGRVLVTRRLPDGGLDPLAGHDLVGPKPDDAPYTSDELRAHARQCDAIVSLLTDRIDADVLRAGAQTGRLRIVANVAVGYDNIDVQTATTLGITVCNTPGVLDDTT